MAQAKTFDDWADFAHDGKVDGTVKEGDVIKRFKRVIMACRGDQPLLTRYHIVNNRWFGVYVHHFHQSDDDRAFHDHPWSFVTIPLRGYWEATPGGVGRAVKWVKAFRMHYRPATHQHIVLLRGEKPTWTICLRGPEKRAWGFVVPGRGWINFKAYGREFCS